jgi:hypothetical protein
VGLTALLFSGLGEKGRFGHAATHKGRVAEFYRCWCFSATSLGSQQVVRGTVSLRKGEGFSPRTQAGAGCDRLHPEK